MLKYAAILGLAAATVLPQAPARAADDGCRPIVDAMMKATITPKHTFMTRSAAKPGGKSRDSEMITTADAMYIMTNGKWLKRPFDGGEQAKELKEQFASLSQTCSSVRGETVDGEATRLYTVHLKNDDVTSDSQIWLSPSRGLPMKQVIELEGDDPGSKDRIAIRFDYANIKPPANVQ